LTRAKINAQKNHSSERILFIQSNLFDGLNQGENLQMIVSNPPYISKPELARLPIEVKNEPVAALDGGQDGLDFYRLIARDAFKYLAHGGYLIMEIGDGQAPAVKKILMEQKRYTHPVFIEDLNNIERVVLTRKL
jgi:release factor glutamine methyltransferase